MPTVARVSTVVVIDGVAMDVCLKKRLTFWSPSDDATRARAENTRTTHEYIYIHTPPYARDARRAMRASPWTIAHASVHRHRNTRQNHRASRSSARARLNARARTRSFNHARARSRFRSFTRIRVRVRSITRARIQNDSIIARARRDVDDGVDGVDRSIDRHARRCMRDAGARRVVRTRARDDDGDDGERATRGRVDVAPIVVVVVVTDARARWTRETTGDGGWVSIRCGRACATTTRRRRTRERRVGAMTRDDVI